MHGPREVELRRDPGFTLGSRGHTTPALYAVARRLALKNAGMMKVLWIAPNKPPVQDSKSTLVPLSSDPRRLAALRDFVSGLVPRVFRTTRLLCRCIPTRALYPDMRAVSRHARCMDSGRLRGSTASGSHASAS